MTKHEREQEFEEFLQKRWTAHARLVFGALFALFVFGAIYFSFN
jgi:hypothetical protein